MEIFVGLLFGLVLFAIWRMWRERNGTIDKPKTDPAFDESEGQPEVAEAVDLLRAEDWRGLTRLYGRLSPSDRYHLIDSLGRMATSPPAAPPEEADSSVLTILGGARLIQGLKLSGQGPARSVVKANMDRMKEAISLADRELREASSRNPDDSTNLALQIRAESAGLRDSGRVNNLVGRIQVSGEDNIYAALNHLLFHWPGFEGSAEGMWKVANEWANAGPNGAWLAIPARAHIEEWSYAMHFCPHGSPERDTMISLQSDEGFKRHIANLDDMFWSALSRMPINGAEFSFAHNHFAFLMHIFRVDDRAGRHLDLIGEHISRHPWSLLPTGALKPTQLLADLRKQYGLPLLGTRS